MKKGIVENLRKEIKALRTEVEALKADNDFWAKEIRDLEKLGIQKAPGPYLKFEVHLSEHCNLNCKGCDHFSPLARPELADYNVFCRDFARMADLFGENVHSIHLLGGEPLLNPHIVRFMRASRQYFSHPKHTVIQLVTNGTLLLKQPEEFWRECRESSIILAVTKYPLDLNYHSIESKSASEGVAFCYYDNTDQGKKLYRIGLKLSGDMDARRSFFKCPSANECCFLKNGRLYPCTLIPNIHHFSKYFGVNMPVTEEDSIDIFVAKDKEEIFTFLSRPRKFCRFCDTENVVYNLDWEVTERRIEEWLADKH